MSRTPLLIFSLIFPPIIDTFYSKKFGRRKTWSVPSMLINGILLIYFSKKIENLIENAEFLAITSWFFVFQFFTTIREMTCDGWTLTLLSRENVGMIGICCSTGYTIGDFLGFTFPMILRDWGIGFEEFLLVVGVVYVIVSLLAGIFEGESDASTETESSPADHAADQITFTQTLKIAFHLLKQQKFLIYAITILSSTFALFTITTSFEIKLVKIGYPSSEIASINVVATIVKLILPWVFQPLLTNGRPLTFYLWFSIFGLVVSGLALVDVYLLSDRLTDGEGDNTSYPLTLQILTKTLLISSTSIETMFYTITSSFSGKVADPIVGASSMTVYLTVINIYIFVAKPIFMYLVEEFGFYEVGIFNLVMGVVCYFLIKGKVVEIDGLEGEEWYYKGSEGGDRDLEKEKVAII